MNIWNGKRFIRFLGKTDKDELNLTRLNFNFNQSRKTTLNNQQKKYS